MFLTRVLFSVSSTFGTTFGIRYFSQVQERIKVSSGSLDSYTRVTITEILDVKQLFTIIVILLVM